ncbi:hypothetical protein [Salibaculum griseiflavum]|uniref:hypothetical protein n=1 Tax=Salibaculum griseiflavum TaxID=1914409 RepID=UPI0011B1CD00|nr:hypothetical protein [Salibaculum griseiflavum]
MKGLKTIKEKEYAYLIDGLRYSLFATNLAYQRILRSASEIESILPNQPSLMMAFETMSDCWQVLDHTYRSLEIFKALAPLRIKNAKSRKFTQQAERTASFRSFYHHLKKNIREIPDKSPPVIGSLTWAHSQSPQKCLALSISSGSSEFSVPSLTVDNWTGEFVSNYMFHMAGKQISLQELCDSSTDMDSVIEEFLEERGALGSGLIASR